MDEGFTAFLDNQGVVYSALARAGVHRWAPDYDDLWMLAVAGYRDYYHQYQPAITGADFNRLAGWLLQRDVQHARTRTGKRPRIEAAADAKMALPPDTTIDITAVEVQAKLAALMPHLTPIEQAIVHLRLDKQLNNREIGERLHLSAARIGQLRKHIRAVYAELD